MAWFSGLFSGKKRYSQRQMKELVEVPRALPKSTARGGEPRSDTLPRFHGTASDQLHRSRGSALERARFRLRSAFTPSQPVRSARMFAGRMEVLKTLIRSIEDQQLHVILYGDRGIGKTSLLHILAQLAREARYIVRYGSCGEGVEFTEMFRAILKDIPLLYHIDYEPTSVEIEEGKSLADLLPDGPLTVTMVSDILAKLAGTRVLIVLDEFDRAESQAFRRAIAELIKNLSDRSVRVQIVIAGVAANLTELIEHIPSIRRNILGLQVPSMNSTEIDELISNGQEACGLTFEQEAKALIAAAAYGSPYIASLLCQNAGLAAVERGANSVARQDAAQAIHQAVDEIEHRVSSRSLHYIARAYEDGHASNLGMLARAALHSSGRLLPHQSDMVLGEGKGADFVSMIGDKYGLTRPIADDPEGAFQFCEEGVPVYMWMRLAQDKLTAEDYDISALDRMAS